MQGKNSAIIQDILIPKEEIGKIIYNEVDKDKELYCVDATVVAEGVVLKCVIADEIETPNQRIVAKI